MQFVTRLLKEIKSRIYPNPQESIKKWDKPWTEDEERHFLFLKLQNPDPYYRAPGCNRVTNSPCSASGTDPSEDKCVRCGTQFPGWY
jgi:hypothetical protein